MKQVCGQEQIQLDAYYWLLDAGDQQMRNFLPLIELLIRVRAQLCTDKQWALADEIRERLADLGIILEDGPTGATWRRA